MRIVRQVLYAIKGLLVEMVNFGHFGRVFRWFRLLFKNL